MKDMLKDKVCLVTGGGSGIGRATALAFAREGAKVVVSDMVVAGGEETVEMIESAGGTAIFVKADVTNESEIEALVNQTIKSYGRLKCAFNNAGLWVQDWERIINVSLRGIWLCMKQEIPHMVNNGGGAIVNTSSMVGLVGRPSLGVAGYAYCASKHGVLGLTRTAALDYAKDNVRVNAVCPGPIQTPLAETILVGVPKNEVNAEVPMGRMGTPSEVAEAVVWLCSDAASYVTGIAMPIDGGLTAL